MKAWPISQVAFYASWEVLFTGALWEEVAVHERNSAEVMVAGRSTVYHADPDSLMIFGGHTANIPAFRYQYYFSLKPEI